MKKITSIDSVKLAIGIQSVLLDMLKKYGEAKYPVDQFERLIIVSKDVSENDARLVTEKVISTGIIRWSISDNAFVL